MELKRLPLPRVKRSRYGPWRRRIPRCACTSMSQTAAREARWSSLGPLAVRRGKGATCIAPLARSSTPATTVSTIRGPFTSCSSAYACRNVFELFRQIESFHGQSYHSLLICSRFGVLSLSVGSALGLTAAYQSLHRVLNLQLGTDAWSRRETSSFQQGFTAFGSSCLRP